MTAEEIHKQWLELSQADLLADRAEAYRNGDWLRVRKCDHYLSLHPQGFARAVKIS